MIFINRIGKILVQRRITAINIDRVHKFVRIKRDKFVITDDDIAPDTRQCCHSVFSSPT